jgi:tetratricopeptide (TPR) repeat protein
VLSLAPALAGPEAADLRSRLIDWWSTGVPGPVVLNPVRAGRFGEDLVARALGSVEGAADVLDRLLRLPSDRQVSQALALLARAHPGHPRLAELTDEAVLRGLPELADRAVAASATSGPADAPSRSDLPLALLRLLTPAVLAQLTSDRPAELTAACTELAQLADDLGRPDQARSLREAARQVEPATAQAATAEATIAEAATAEEPALGGAQSGGAAAPVPPEQGEDPATIEAGYRRRLEVAEELLRQEPDNPAHRREVARAHAGLAELDQAAHRLALADAGYRRALGALEQLVAIEPNNREHRHALAAALTRLADLDAAAGWSAQAAAGYRRAAEIKKEIAALDRAQDTDQRLRDRAQ